MIRCDWEAFVFGTSIFGVPRMVAMIRPLCRQSSLHPNVCEVERLTPKLREYIAARFSEALT